MNFSTAAAIAFGVLVAGPAAAATQFFDWEMRATFDSVGAIGGVAIDAKEVVISGQTTTDLSDSPWASNPITAPLDLSSVTLRFDGADIGASLDTTSFFTYGLLGGDAQMRPAPEFRFNQSGDFGADEPFESIVFKMDFGGVDTWIGFGGQGGKRVAITTALVTTPTNADVVDFSLAATLQQLTENNNMRSFSVVNVAPIPLPAGLWLLLSAFGGLALLRRRGRLA